MLDKHEKSCDKNEHMYLENFKVPIFYVGHKKIKKISHFSFASVLSYINRKLVDFVEFLRSSWKT